MKHYLYLISLCFLGCQSPVPEQINSLKESQQDTIALVSNKTVLSSVQNKLSNPKKLWTVYEIGKTSLGKVTDSCTFFSESCWVPDHLYLDSDSNFIYAILDGWDYQESSFGVYSIKNDSLYLHFNGFKKMKLKNWSTEIAPFDSKPLNFLIDTIVKPLTTIYAIDTTQSCIQLKKGKLIGIKKGNAKEELKALIKHNLFLNIVSKQTWDSLLITSHYEDALEHFYKEEYNYSRYLDSSQLETVYEKMEIEGTYLNEPPAIVFSDDSSLKVCTYRVAINARNYEYSDFISYIHFKGNTSVKEIELYSEISVHQLSEYIYLIIGNKYTRPASCCSGECSQAFLLDCSTQGKITEIPIKYKQTYFQSLCSNFVIDFDHYLRYDPIKQKLEYSYLDTEDYANINDNDSTRTGFFKFSNGKLIHRNEIAVQIKK